MRKIVLSISLCLCFAFLKAQTINLTPASPEIFCSNGIDSFKVAWNNIPTGSNIVFYQSTNPAFDPYLGQGDSIGFIHITTSSSTPTAIKTVCPEIVGIFIDACNAPPHLEQANEYMVITSGNSGFLPSTLFVNLPANKDINNGAGTCSFQTPSSTLMNLLWTGSCNPANLIAAGPSDFIPADALVVIFTGAGTDYPYNFSGFCSTGQPIYILQNACTQPNGSFLNTAPASGCPNNYRTTTITSGSCFSELTYAPCTLPVFDPLNPNAGDGNYVIHLPSTDTSSVTNGGIQNNAADKCNGVVLDTTGGSQTIKYPIPNDGSANPLTNFCNTGYHYIKAITHPNATQPVSNNIKFKLICIDLNTVPQNQTICSGDHAIINNSSTDPGASFSWTVAPGLNIQGASSGSGNTINQLLTNTGAVKDSVSYTITAKDSSCTISKVVKIYVNPKPIPFNLGNDTSYCGNFSRLLITGISTTVWQRNSVQIATASSVTATQIGTYIATINSSCGNVSDTIVIGQTSTQAPINLGNDTSYCGTFSRVLVTGDPSTVWSTGATASQISVTQPGKYWAKIAGSCGTVSDTINITQSPGLPFSFGGNTSICKNSTVSLDAGIGYTAYLWSTGETTQKIIISNPGKYWAQVSKNGCQGSDTIIVTQIDKPASFNLGRDTAYCGNFNQLLSSGNAQTTWFRNGTQVAANTASLNITLGGTYIASAANSCGTVSDTIIISTANAIPLNLGNDTAICAGQSVTLNATVPGNSITYLWKTGEQTPTITVNQVDRYWVEVSNGICTVSDSILVDTVGKPNPIFLGNDTAYCGPFSRQLFTGDNTIWSTGVTATGITVTQAGTYIAENKNQCGSEKDTIVITQNPLPPVSLGKDSTICDSIVLSVGNGNYVSVLWSTNDTTNSIVVFSSGIYSVLVSDGVCLNSDSVRINKECLYDVYLPSAFTPNGDGLNDVLVPMSNIKGIQVLSFSVFNRWGEKVFESSNFLPSDKTNGWNGTFKGENCQQDSYAFYFSVKLPDDQVKTYKGTITLMR